MHADQVRLVDDEVRDSHEYYYVMNRKGDLFLLMIAGVNLKKVSALYHSMSGVESQLTVDEGEVTG